MHVLVLVLQMLRGRSPYRFCTTDDVVDSRRLKAGSRLLRARGTSLFGGTTDLLCFVAIL
jgi:hypothetical protein